MATTQLSPLPVQKFFDNNGNPLFNGKLFTYAAGTTTPQTSYLDSTGNNANTNPIILNSRGECNLWLSPSLGYKIVLQDSVGNPIWTVDNITAPLVQIPYGVTSGTNTILLNTSPSFGTLTDGLTIVFKIANTTTAVATINVNSTATLNLYYSDGVTQLIAGALVANEVYEAIYNSSLNSGAGGWVVINPTLANPATILNYWADTGAVNALAIAAPIAAYANGQSFLVKVANTTTNSMPTLNVNSLGAKNLYYPDGTTQILAGALILNTTYRMTYNSSLNAAAGAFVVESPSRLTGSFTLTISTSYLTVQQTGTILYAIGGDGKTIIARNTSAILGTSNSTTMVGTGIPSILAPVTSTSGAHRPFYLGEDNSALFVGFVDVGQASAGTWQFFGNTTLSTGGFTSTGTKGVADFELTFNKD